MAKRPLATTWRPTGEATTSWVPNLKLSATELSKNLTTTAALNASNLSANVFLLLFPGSLRAKLPNDSSYRTQSLKTLPGRRGARSHALSASIHEA